MARFNFSAARLFIDTPLAAGVEYSCLPDHLNYLIHVLRLKDGDEVLVFNGKDGEWRARIATSGKRRCFLNVFKQIRLQEKGPDIHYLFAPLKRARQDYMVQKATELGVSLLQPVFTDRTNVSRLKIDRIRANTIEAAEQCGILYLPAVCEPQPLAKVLSEWQGQRALVFCDENAEISSPLDALSSVDPGPIALLVGPEGGFSEDEQSMLRKLPFVTAISLGERIMRADTAAVAALSLVNAVLGDW